MKSKISLDQVKPFSNEEFEGIRFIWSGDIGWGQCDVFRPVGKEDEPWKVDTECLGKDFMRLLVDQWMNQIEVVG